MGLLVLVLGQFPTSWGGLGVPLAICRPRYVHSARYSASGGTGRRVAPKSRDVSRRLRWETEGVHIRGVVGKFMAKARRIIGVPPVRPLKMAAIELFGPGKSVLCENLF